MDVLERDDQLATLGQHLEAARVGEGRLVWVQGQAGVGKTALVRRFCEQVRGARVVTGSCDPFDTPRPLGPVIDLADRLDLAEVDPAQGPPRSREALFRRFLDELASHTWVTVAVIEDVHWADEATLDLLRYVGRRLAGVRALVVVTFRDDEVASGGPLQAVIGDLATAAGTVRLEVPCLSRQGVATLVSKTAPRYQAELEALYRSTGGNPFFVTEVLAAPAGPVPPTVRDAVLARTSRLPEDARKVVEAAAVVPTRAEIALLRDLVDVDDAALDTCVDLGILRPDTPGAVAFRHELARRAVDESLPPARRSGLHAHVAELLLARHGDEVDAARVAYHAEQAGQAARARDFAIRAARRATELGAHREAAAQYDRALRHASGLSDEQRARLLEACTEEARRVDHVDVAYETATEAVDLRRRLGEPRALGIALRLQSSALWGVGQSAEAHEVIREAIRTLEALEPGEELAEAYASAAAFAMLARDRATATLWGGRAAALAERLGSTTTLAHALNVVGASKLVSGVPGGVEDLQRSLRLATDAGDDPLMALAWCNLGSGAGEVRDHAVAEPALREGIAFTAERDQDHMLHYLTAWLARVRLERGDAAEAERLAGQVPLHDQGISVPTEIVARGVLGRLHARRGDADPGPELERAWALATETGDLQRLWPIAAARAEAAWLAGDVTAIPALVDEAFDLACGLGLAWPIGELGLWHRRGGGEKVVPDAAAVPWALQIAGRPRESAARWESLDCPYEAADALADSGDIDDLRDALERFTTLDAPVPATRVRRRLRGLGVRDLPRGPRPATAAHPAGLTPRQAEVLELLALGLTDADVAARLHLSTKTVGHHVSAILQRLDVPSRGRAVHRGRELGVLPLEPGEDGEA